MEQQTIQQSDPIKQYILAAANKSLKGLIILGQAGIGKSYSVFETLKETNYIEGEHYVVIRGHITPLELFKWMQNNHDKLMIFDDVTGLFENPVSIGLLKNACDTTSNQVVYKTAERYGIHNPSFEFTGSMIVITNDCEIYSKPCEPLRSRMIIYTMEVDYWGKIRIIRDSLSQKVDRIGQEKILNYIIENTSPFTELDVRIGDKMVSLYNHSRENNISFDPLAKGVFPNPEKKDEQELMILQLLEQNKTVERTYKVYKKLPKALEWSRGEIPSQITFYRIISRIKKKANVNSIKEYKQKMNKLKREILELR